MSYLEDYLEKVGSLPIDINRGLRLIRELDARYQNANSRLEELQHEYLSRLKNSKDKKQEAQKQETQALLEEIRQLQEECLAYCKSKVDTAAQNYDLVDKQIEKLDEELKKFEDEIRDQGDKLSTLQDDTAMKETKRLKKMDSKGGVKLQKLKTADKNTIHNILDMGSEILEAANTPVDKNEPRYCICNGISYGDMIKCDNPFCEKEWFHFACIGMVSKPKGKWFCGDCKDLKKKNMLKF